MLKHKRWLCKECKREWIDSKYLLNSTRLTITGNKRDDLCPICGSGSIEEVEFEPHFLGGDIPRKDSIITLPDGANTGEEVAEIPKGNAGFIVQPLTLLGDKSIEENIQLSEN